MVGSGYLIKFFILGNVCLALGLLVNYALPPLISMYIDTQITLTPNSQSYPMWKELPVPVYQKFYFFNVTNAQEIESRGVKPQLEELGPFVYRSDWTKKDIDIDTDQSTINFKQTKQWQFEPDLSVAGERTQITTINAPLAITLTLIQSASNAVRLLVTFSLDGLSEGFFTRRTIKQLLFEGYPDLLTTFGPLLNAEMLSQGGHFGYMNARNNTLDGAYEINTGADDISKLNTINKFNGKPELPYWSKQPGSKCNSLEGATTGEMFPPIMDEDDDDYYLADNSTSPSGGSSSSVLKLFQPDFCRVWPLNYESKFEHPSGLRLKRFVATRDVFRNSTDLPENSCFFTSPKSRQHHSPEANRIPQTPAPPPQAPQSMFQRLGRNRANQQQQQQHHGGHHHKVRHEWPAGVFTLAPCKFNAPIYISMPHFLDADPYFQSHVDGLQPDPTKHEFYIDVEPRTGSPVTLSARVQLNVAISKPPGLVRFRNVPEIMFPVFWQELTVNVTGPVIDQLLMASRHTQEATVRISYSFLLLGAAVLITTGVFYLHILINSKLYDEPMRSSSSSPPPPQPPLTPVLDAKKEMAKAAAAIIKQ